MTEDDHRLWQKVAATVTPLRPEDGEALMRAMSDERPNEAITGRSRAFRKPLPLPVSPSTLDLHGLTVDDAYRATLDFIENSGRRSTITIITGKSGQIRREFERWVEGMPKVHSIKSKCDGGAFTIRVLKSYR